MVVIGKELVELIKLAAGEAEVIKEILVAIEVMEVGTHIGIESLFKEFLCHELGTAAIIATEGHEIKLEIVTFIMEKLVVSLIHVHVTFRVGNKRLKACLPHIQKDVLEVHGATHIRSFNKKMIMAKAEG